MISPELILEYENCLLGKSNNISLYYFGYDKRLNMNTALSIMRYAFETYLKWDPVILRDHISQSLLDKLCLTPLMRFIIFPPELEPEQNLSYIVWKLYPNVINYEQNDLILNVYKSLLSGIIQRFPKEFFTGMDGLTRAELCLQYMLEQYVSITDIKELYQLMSSSRGNAILRKYKLLSVCEDSYLSPLDFLHSALPKTQKDDLWYSYYTFIYYKKLNEKKDKLSCKEN